VHVLISPFLSKQLISLKSCELLIGLGCMSNHWKEEKVLCIFCIQIRDKFCPQQLQFLLFHCCSFSVQNYNFFFLSWLRRDSWHFLVSVLHRWMTMPTEPSERTVGCVPWGDTSRPFPGCCWMPSFTSAMMGRFPCTTAGCFGSMVFLAARFRWRSPLTPRHSGPRRSLG
jgi:hypothetical protein